MGARPPLTVQGMHCQSCALLIEETFANDPCVYEVTVDLDSARATVTFEAGDASGDTMCAIVTNLGYPAALLAADSPGP